MSLKIEPSNKDALAELFRQKLENHQVPVDSHSWSKLKKQLGSNGKVALWIAFAAASAAVIALLFILSPSDKAPVDHPLQVESPTKIMDDNEDRTIAKENIDLPSQQEQDVKIADSSSETIKGNSKSSLRPESKWVRDSLMEDKPSNFEIIEQEIAQEPILLAAALEGGGNNKVDEKIAAIDKTIEQISQNQSADIKPEVKQSLYLTEFIDDFSEKKNSNSWTLAAHYSGNAGANSDATHMQTPTRADVLNHYEGSMEIVKQTAVREYTEEKHFPGMSASFTVGKKLNDRLTIESGLTYSYLYSKFEWSDPLFSYDQKQSLHYIGVPVNLIVYAFKGETKWNAYVSGGIMLEKGIQANYKETAKDALGKCTTNTESSSISGFQWSLNASIGANYNFNKNLSLYIAPRLSYYFDNDQPESIRTSNDISFGAVVGFRYNL